MLKLLIGALAVLAVGAVLGAFAVYRMHDSTSAGGLPTAVAVNPGLVGQTPAATATAISKRDGAAPAAMLSADDAIAAAMSHVAAGETVDRAASHAVQTTAGMVADLKTGGTRYASDYPVLVVTLHGTFTPAFGPPPGPGETTTKAYSTATYYLDGYTGAVIGRALDSGLAPVTATP